MWNQVSTPNFTSQNDQRNKTYILGDFDNKTPTYMAATHVISKSERNFQNRIPRELGKIFYTSRFDWIGWITSNIQILKNCLYNRIPTVKLKIPIFGVPLYVYWKIYGEFSPSNVRENLIFDNRYKTEQFKTEW